MGLCHHQIMARAEKEDFFKMFAAVQFLAVVLFFVVSPEDQVLRLEVEVGDLADQGASRSGEHSDRVNSWVRSENEQALMHYKSKENIYSFV